jgi:hypothetical protein
VGDVKRDERRQVLSPAHFMPQHSCCAAASNNVQPPPSPARNVALFFAMTLSAYPPFRSGDHADQLDSYCTLPVKSKKSSGIIAAFVAGAGIRMAQASGSSLSKKQKRTPHADTCINLFYFTER